jgi:uncharacterized protein YbaA (DUF1428 family)
MADARMKTLKMPFDGQRMIFGGFSPIVEKGSAKGASYTDGFVVPVPAANRDAYIRVASNAATRAPITMDIRDRRSYKTCPIDLGRTYR